MMGDVDVDVVEGGARRAEVIDVDLRAGGLRAAPGLVGAVELHVARLEAVALEKGVARAEPPVPGERRRQRRVAGRRDGLPEGSVQHGDHAVVRAQRDGRPRAQAEGEGARRLDEDAGGGGKARRRRVQARERVAGLVFVVLAGARRAIAEVDERRAGEIEDGVDEVQAHPDVEPVERLHADRERGQDDGRGGLHDVVARRRRRRVDARGVGAVADAAGTEDAERHGQPVERAEVGGHGEKGREEGPPRVADAGKREAAPRRRRVARVVGEGAEALERVARVDDVPVEEHPRAPLLGEARRVVVDGRRVVGLGDERPAATERLGAVVGDLEAAGVGGAGGAEQRHHETDP